jgi:hypothetical protein
MASILYFTLSNTNSSLPHIHCNQAKEHKHACEAKDREEMIAELKALSQEQPERLLQFLRSLGSK